MPYYITRWRFLNSLNLKCFHLICYYITSMHNYSRGKLILLIHDNWSSLYRCTCCSLLFINDHVCGICTHLPIRKYTANLNWSSIYTVNNQWKLSHSDQFFFIFSNKDIVENNSFIHSLELINWILFIEKLQYKQFCL